MRVSSGNSNQKDGPLGKSWAQAQVGIPIEQGFNISTGTGKAEIEFEDGSALYLADNSALLFEQLVTLSGAPSTFVELISGTATIDMRPIAEGTFHLDTPSTDHVTITGPANVFLRVDSYLDGMVVTPQLATTATHEGAGAVHFQPVKRSSTTDWECPPSRTRRRRRRPTRGISGSQAASLQRHTAMQAALKASGLTKPVPGLVDLNEHGTFSPCAPYGTCWQPAAAGSTDAPPEDNSSPAPQSTAQASQSAPQNPAQSLPPAPQRQVAPHPITRFVVGTQGGTWPCAVTNYRQHQTWDPLRRIWVVDYTDYLGQDYWNRAGCRAGNWVHRNHGFFLVLHKPTKKHHHPPLAWVHAGNKTGFVPRSPLDKAGKLPVNLKYGLFVPSGKPDEPANMQPVKSSDTVKILAAPPKQFVDITSVLPHQERPVIQAQVLDQNSLPKPTSLAEQKDTKSVITYDYGKKGFVASRSSGSGSTPKPVLVATLDPRGSIPLGGAAWDHVVEPGGHGVVSA